MRILLAEDDDETATYLERGLLDFGHQVLRAATGEDALQLGVTESPEIIVLDRMLPGIKGLDVLRACFCSYPRLCWG
jgi:two-component system OmpR family response regulator